tara:strand:- start:329 stop:523 length:195 start_codon:yes stop_codon:yes gene_type:complete
MANQQSLRDQLDSLVRNFMDQKVPNGKELSFDEWLYCYQADIGADDYDTGMKMLCLYEEYGGTL